MPKHFFLRYAGLLFAAATLSPHPTSCAVACRAPVSIPRWDPSFHFTNRAAMSNMQPSIRIFSCIILVLGVAPGHSASFDCGKAATAVEKSICRDSGLSALDEELSRLYKQALSRTPNPQALKAEQRQWLKTERNRCSDGDCLHRAYNGRIEALSDAPKPTAIIEGLTGIYEGDTGELRVRELDGRIRFHIYSSFRMNTGEVSGDAVVEGTTAEYVNREQNCRLAFRFTPSGAILSQEGTCGMGLNVTADGEYRRTSGAIPVFEQ